MAQQNQRGIRITLPRVDWRLIAQALRLVGLDNSNHELDEERYECGRIANYITMHLDAQE